MKRYIVAALVIALAQLVPTTASASARHDGLLSGWSTYLGNNSRTGYDSSEYALNPSNVGKLQVFRRITAGGSISDEPIVAGGVIYWGSWDGLLHATSVYGKQLWAVNLGQTDTGPNSGCDPNPVGVAGSVTVASVSSGGFTSTVVFAPGGDAQMYAISAQTGAILWHTSLGLKNAAFLWGSPLFYKGHIYEGVASYGDCPLVQGHMVELNAVTGAPVSSFNAVPNGCTGATIWATPAIDTTTGIIYDTTGNSGDCSKPQPYAQAFIALRASNLSLVGSWSVPSFQLVDDSDFGATPTLFTATIKGVKVPMVGAVNKNGVYYALRRAKLGAGPVWSVRVGTGGSNPQGGSGNISPSSFDGQYLYVGSGNTTVGTQNCAGSVRALSPATGQTEWVNCVGSPVIGAVIGAPGLVIAAEGDEVDAFYPNTGAVLDQTVISGAQFWGPPTLSDGVVLVGGIDGHLYELTPTTFG